MESKANIRNLKEKIKELQNYMDDFINLHKAKKNKIQNLENEINDIKQNMNKYLDDIEDLIDH